MEQNYLNIIKKYKYGKRNPDTWKEGHFDANKRPLFIGIAGGSASGKSTLAKELNKSFHDNASVVNLDSFYKNLSQNERELSLKYEYNFDSPQAVDLDLAYEKILSLLQYKDVEIPIYSIITNKM